MKKFSMILTVMIFAIAFFSSADGSALSDETEGPVRAKAKVLDYADIYSRVRQLQGLMDSAISAAEEKSESPIPALTNEAIADWFGVDRNFQHKDGRDGDGVIARDENDALLIKRHPGYLRVIDKAALVEDRALGTKGDRTLTLTENGALAAAADFARYLGISGEDVSRADVKKILAEAGGDHGEILSRIEVEYLVTLHRSHKGVLVPRSMLRFTIDNDGKVKRLLARWPALEPQPEKKSPIEPSKVAEAIYTQLDAIYYKNPILRYSLMPAIHYEEKEGIIYAEPVIHVMAIGDSSEVSEPVNSFDVNLMK